jgi:hypothetical protein
MANAETPQPHALSRGKELAYGLIVALTVLLMAGCVGEVGLRLTGHRPWNPAAHEMAQSVEPGGTLHQPDADLGYAPLPGGPYTVVQRALSWHTSHGAPGRRVTRPAGGPPPAGVPGTWIFGDSHTYGWGLEDHQTYAWLLQQRHPDWEVTNFGTGGYSTVHGLIQLERELAAGARPAVVVVAYASFHDGRNAHLAQNRKAWIHNTARYPALPGAWLERGELRYGMRTIRYDAWLLEQHSALVNWLRDKWNKAEILRAQPEKVSRAVIRRMGEICATRGITFVVAGIFPNQRTRDVLAWAGKQGFTTVDIAVPRIPENILAGDGHPSAHANTQFADKLEPVVQAVLLQRVTHGREADGGAPRRTP